VKIELFDFELPPGSIAQRPAARREDARLLVVDAEPSHFVDAHVFDWPELVVPGSLIVLNDTKVVRTRLLGRKATGGKVELLLVEPSAAHAVEDLRAANDPRGPDGAARQGSAERWRALGRGLGELVGQRISFDVAAGSVDAPPVNVERHSAADSGLLVAQIEGPSTVPGVFDIVLFAPAGTVSDALDALGQVPIPPYVRRAADAGDRDRYQTVYAREPGAIAAPTAGLHLTQSLLDRIERRGARLAYVTLHVGLGTFQPVAAGDLDDHPMHAEWMHVSAEVAAEIADARRREAPVVAVGTTVVRALETAADPNRAGHVLPTQGETRMLIQPGYDFRVVDALLTNFHVPRSTLIALVAAFAGRARLLHAYDYAIRGGYRFYSYGDAMWLPRRARA
jgi:S-adenosylmethionine:tRNA ribosyltransferase-isomerase